MNSAQKLLIEKTLGWVGWLAIAAPIGMLLYGFFLLATISDYRFTTFWHHLFMEEEALMIWPPLIIGFILLWARAFSRAGGHGESVKAES
jgi:hypothetical protein